MANFDLDAYLERVGFAGSRAPTLATLRALHLAHPLAIPFENLDVQLGRPVGLSLEVLVDKLVHARRGGYCYEHNLLLAEVLRALGFEVRQLAARVQWNDPSGRVNGRTHMLLRVVADGAPYFVDVGFGGLVQTGPLRADLLDAPQETPHERFRLVPLEEGELQLQAEVQGSFKPLYRFDLQAQELPDYELANYWIYSNPGSRFVQNLICARVVEDRRYALLNNAFAVHHLGGASERRVVTDAVELRALLAGPLGISLPNDAGLDALLERLARTPAPA